jgi:hypothetical protein
MKVLKTISVLICIFLISACSSSSKKDTVKSDPSLLDQYWKTSSKLIASKKYSKPMKWAAGQYTVTGSINKGVKESITRATVVGKEGKGWIFESISIENKGKKSGMQMMFEGYDEAVAKKDASKIQVKWAKILQPDGKIQKLEEQALMFYNMILKSTWEKLIIAETKFSDGGAVSVPAGKFAGTSSYTSTVKILFSTTTVSVYIHPDVPVNGVVKTVSDDSSSVQELLDYGFNGKPEIK